MKEKIFSTMTRFSNIQITQPVDDKQPKPLNPTEYYYIRADGERADSPGGTTMIVSEPEIVKRYHDALRRGDPKADDLLHQWEDDVRGQLDALQARSDEHREQAVAVIDQKKRGLKPVYDALIKDYRDAVRLAKDISKVKKLVRDAKQKRGE
jgi:hypothetical protein